MGRKVSDISGAGSESDSLLDLYAPRSGDQSRVSSMDREKMAANGASHLDDDPERSRWIHRDKLAKIESEELQQAGFVLRPDNQIGAKRKIKKERSRDHLKLDLTDDTGEKDNVPRDSKRQWISPPTPVEDDDEQPMTFDLRLPEEAATDPYEERITDGSYTPVRPSSRKSSQSRIPLPRASPLPIRQDFIDKDTPTHRKGSGSWDDGSIAYRKPRARSRSGGSQMLLDDADFPETSNSMPSLRTPPGSPKSRTPVKTPLGNHSRKPSSSQGHVQPTKGSLRSRDVPGARPGTRSGEGTPVVKRPEGDPPWLATMYKPDPRLPPEEQLLPTVAKRLQQEQMEREGKSVDVPEHAAETYEKYDAVQHPAHQPGPEVLQQKEEKSEWPLMGQAGAGGVTAAAAGAAEHGGYKVMPPAQGPLSPSSQAASQRAPDIGNTKETPEDDKKASCRCCIVM